MLPLGEELSNELDNLKIWLQKEKAKKLKEQNENSNKW